MNLEVTFLEGCLVFQVFDDYTEDEITRWHELLDALPPCAHPLDGCKVGRNTYSVYPDNGAILQVIWNCKQMGSRSIVVIKKAFSPNCTLLTHRMWTKYVKKDLIAVVTLTQKNKYVNMNGALMFVTSSSYC